MKATTIQEIRLILLIADQAQPPDVGGAAIWALLKRRTIGNVCLMQKETKPAKNWAWSHKRRTAIINGRWFYVPAEVEVWHHCGSHGKPGKFTMARAEAMFAIETGLVYRFDKRWWLCYAPGRTKYGPPSAGRRYLTDGRSNWRDDDEKTR